MFIFCDFENLWATFRSTSFGDFKHIWSRCSKIRCVLLKKAEKRENRKEENFSWKDYEKKYLKDLFTKKVTFFHPFFSCVCFWINPGTIVCTPSYLWIDKGMVSFPLLGVIIVNVKFLFPFKNFLLLQEVFYFDFFLIFFWHHETLRKKRGGITFFHFVKTSMQKNFISFKHANKLERVM